jgi:hypothetical protein
MPLFQTSLILFVLGVILFFIIWQIRNREPLYVDNHEPNLKKSSNYIARECVKGLRAGININDLMTRFPDLQINGRLLYVCSSAIIPLILSGELSIKQLGPRAHDMACAAKYVIERAFEDAIIDLSQKQMDHLISIADELGITLCSPNLLTQMRASAYEHKKEINLITAPLKYYSADVRAKIKADLAKLLA